ncbi:MAG TPA: RHS repeat-associated core domain-containing protein, partial [Acidimicrobiales bacterium]
EVISVAAGADHTLALTENGTVWAWGRNDDGQLGNGSSADSPVPVQVSGLTDVVAISAGSYHSLAVRSNGELYAWGQNSDAQLGFGYIDYIPHVTPARVTGIPAVASVAGGGMHSLAVTTGGLAYAWGYNDVGAIGVGHYGFVGSPAPVAGLSGVSAVAAGYWHSMALKTDGTVWTWGYSTRGQLGNGWYGSSAYTASAMQVSGISNAKVIAAPGAMSVAVRGDGVIQTWGDNGLGQLALGNTVDRTSPVGVSGFSQSTPAAPTTLEAVPGEKLAFLTWKAPASVVTQYVVTPYRNGIAQPTVGTKLPKLEFPVPALVDGDTYRFEIQGQNCLGDGAVSAASNRIVPLDVELDETGFSIEGWDINDRHSARVNAGNGNLKVTANDLRIEGTGFPLTVSRSYNSRAATTSVFGKNWTTTVGADVKLQILATGSVFFHGPGGSKFGFPKDGTTFTSPAGVNATLTQNTTTGVYTLTAHATADKLTFSSTGVLTERADRNGNKLTYTYTAGRLTKVTDTQNRDITFLYDASGRIERITDIALRTWRYAYTNGNLTTYTDPLGGVTTYTYNAADKLTKIETPGGTGVRRVVEFAYDASSRISKLTYPLQVATPTACSSWTTKSVTCFAYGPTETTVTDANGNPTKYEIDPVGRTTKVTDALGNTTSTSYTSNSNVKQRSIGGAATTFEYSALNAATGMQLDTGARYEYVYADPAHPHQPTRITDPQGNQFDFAYDVPGNLDSMTNDLAVDNQVDVTRNAKGQVTVSSDPRDEVTGYQYDTAGNLKKITPPAPLGFVTLTNDALSRVKTVRDGKGQTETYTYDVLDRVTRIDYQDGSSVVYTYDGDGNIVQTTDALGVVTMTYDQRNNLVSRTTADGTTVSYTYDGMGNLASITDPGGTVRYSYNAANLLAAVVEPDDDAIVVSYDKDYNRSAVRYPNGASVFTTYNDAKQVTKINALNASQQTLMSVEYSYVDPATGDDTVLRYSAKDKDGNVTAYKYDALNRLTRAKTTSPANAVLADYVYGYDGAGNRTTESTFDGTVTRTGTNTFDAANEQLTRDNVVTMTYDANGNQTGSLLGTEYVYNAKDQTVSMRAAGPPVEMRYHGRGQAERASLGQAGSPVLAFTNTMIGITAESVGGAVRRGYVRDETGGLLAQTTTAGANYVVTDGVGSVIGMLGEDGSLAGTLQYAPFGETTKTTGVAASMPFRFAGGYLDPTGLYKLGERYYDAALGRFTQPDPVENAFDPKHWNRYSYAGGDPVNFADPTGLSPWSRAWDAIKCAGKVAVDIAWIIPSLGNAVVDVGIGIGGAGGALVLASRPMFAGGMMMAGASTAGLVTGYGLIVIGTGLVAYGLYLTAKEVC